MLLDKDTNKVQVILSAPTATGPIDITAEYQDTIQERITVKTLFVQAAMLGPTDIIGAPDTSNTARDVIELHIYNGDTVSQQLQVALVHPSGTQIIQNVPLAPGDTLHYNRYNGWSIQVAGPGGRGNVMLRTRTVTGNFTVGLDDDIIYVDASAGTVTGTFNPAIVGTLFPGFVKEVEIVKIDASANMVLISDGTSVVDVITTPINAEGGNGGAKFVNTNGTGLRTNGVG